MMHLDSEKLKMDISISDNKKEIVEICKTRIYSLIFKMKRNLKKVVLVLALLLPGVIKAQEFNVTAKADFVSDYIWRGAYQNSGFSVQPTLGLSYGNLSLSAWGVRA
mgnify:CR=1 FL=1